MEVYGMIVEKALDNRSSLLGLMCQQDQYTGFFILTV